MKANERRQALLEYLCEVRQSTLENLAFHFSVLLSTIRRDVLELSLHFSLLYKSINWNLTTHIFI